jgi:lipopolysaccharide cholinephosphotransferase
MIDAATQKALRAKYNPDGSQLRKHQLTMLEMLTWLDDVCLRHNINYWLSSGTLLGAVRHGGYIPWDDDVDVEMPEADFRRLLTVLADEAPAAGYALQHHSNDKEFIFPFAKLRHTASHIEEADGLDALQAFHGLYIDLFPLAPSNSLKLHRLGAKLIGTEQKMRVARPALRPLLAPLRALLSGVVYPLLRTVTAIPLPGTRTYRHVMPSYFSRERVLDECLPTQRIAFEGYMFNAPRSTDAYLTRIYGSDYNSLPATIHSHLQGDDEILTL